MARVPAHPSLRRGSRAVLVVASVLVLVGVPVVVVLLASRERAPAAAAPPRRIVPASGDPRRPATPFFAHAGPGVRPDGIGCVGEGQVVLRAVAHLDVFADGARVTVPAGIGVLPGCTYWLHTGAPDGLVAISSPQRRAFTLGDLFDIWGAPLTATRLLSFRLGPGRPLRTFVDGRAVSGDPRAISLADRREIALVAGRVPRLLPRRFPG
jgi:hypothetical protein